MYVTYKCLDCDINFTMTITDVKRLEALGRELRCPFGHRRIITIDRYKVEAKDLDHDSYSKVNRRTIQKGWG